MDIKPITSLTADEIRDMAEAAAESNTPVHEACPFDPHSEQYHQFQGFYVEHRMVILHPRVPEQMSG